MKKENTTTFFFFFYKYSQPKRERRENGIRPCPVLGVCVCMLSVCVKRKERGNDSVSLRRRIRRKNETLGMSLKKKKTTTMVRWLLAQPEKWDGRELLYKEVLCYFFFFCTRV